jgi:GTP cyclohydrolase II
LAWSSVSDNSLAAFGDAAAIRCERAVAEMRTGRPIVLTSPDAALVALPLDGTTRQAYQAFAQASGGGHQLYVTRFRAEAIGLDAPEGALFQLGDASLTDAQRLGYQRGPLPVTPWIAATPLAAAAGQVARLGLLLPALLTAEAARDQDFGDLAELAMDDLEIGLAAAERAFQIVARTRVPLRRVGDAEFVVFRGGLAQRDQIAVVIGDPDPSQVVPVRVHSACLTGDLFGSLKCDCGDQLKNSLEVLHARGGGVLLYLDQEGRGTGIAAKMRAYGYQHEGMDTVDADAMLGFGLDERRYASATAMLQKLGFSRIDLLTNNPSKVAHLRASGMEVVGRVELTGSVTADNEGYLRTKAARAGHLLDIDLLKAGKAPMGRRA